MREKNIVIFELKIKLELAYQFWSAPLSFFKVRVLLFITRSLKNG
jgi:hypothetical protein